MGTADADIKTIVVGVALLAIAHLSYSAFALPVTAYVDVACRVLDIACAYTSYLLVICCLRVRHQATYDAKENQRVAAERCFVRGV